MQKIKIEEGNYIPNEKENQVDVHEMKTSENESVEFYAITIPPFNPSDFHVV